MRVSFIFVFLFSALGSNAQITSGKKGDIDYNGKRIVEMEKYEGDAQTRPKFRLINVQGDTVLLIRFYKDLAFDWMTFNFKKSNKTIDVNTSDIISGLNYQKNIGSFLVSQKVFDTSGAVDIKALGDLSAKYNENLTEKYRILNEGNRLVLNTKFDYLCDDKSIHVNGRKVGYASVPANEQLTFNGIEYKDLNGNVIARGSIGLSGGIFTTHDGKEIKTGPAGKTTGCGDTMVFVTNILRELFRNGYYRS